MLQKYKEIMYGVLFGTGAVIMDTLMDAWMDGHGFWTELIERRPMLLYRLLFILYGLVLGLLLWQRNSRERDFRNLAEAFRRLRLECGKIAVLMHANLQVLLTRDDLRMSHEAEELVRSMYQESQELQSVVKEKSPLPE